jgi:hypothetical protein
MITDHGGLAKEAMLVEEKRRRHELFKVNLRYEEGENGEGIWALPCTDEDSALWRGETSGQVLYVWLCNDPICKDVLYGSKVACLTNGTKRPYSQELSSPEGREAYARVIDDLLRRRAW